MAREACSDDVDFSMEAGGAECEESREEVEVDSSGVCVAGEETAEEQTLDDSPCNSVECPICFSRPFFGGEAYSPCVLVSCGHVVSEVCVPKLNGVCCVCRRSFSA